MANQIETLVTSAPIKSSADKFYNFFKYNMSDLVKVYSEAFTGCELCEGLDGDVGCVKHWTYILEGTPLAVKVKVEAIDDAAKTLKFVVVEGDVLQLYKSFGATLTVGDGLAKWTIEFEKAIHIAPNPEPYASLAVGAATVVDAYLLIN